MKSNSLNRRQMLIGVTGLGLGALVPDSVGQQSGHEQASPFPPKELGGIHGDMLRNISEKLAGTPLNTEQGMFKVIDLLMEWGIIDKGDRDKVEELIKVIFNAVDPDAMAKRIEQIYSESVTKVGDVAAAVISIARNSIEYAKEKFKEHPKILSIVASDVTGALTGATVGRKLGTKFAVIGALAGAISDSSEAALKGSKPK